MAKKFPHLQDNKGILILISTVEMQRKALFDNRQGTDSHVAASDRPDCLLSAPHFFSCQPACLLSTAGVSVFGNHPSLQGATSSTMSWLPDIRLPDLLFLTAARRLIFAAAQRFSPSPCLSQSLATSPSHSLNPSFPCTSLK